MIVFEDLVEQLQRIFDPKEEQTIPSCSRTLRQAAGNALAGGFNSLLGQVFMRINSQTDAAPKRMFPSQAARSGGRAPDLPRDIPKA